jgi:hypothetical protein
MIRAGLYQIDFARRNLRFVWRHSLPACPLACEIGNRNPNSISILLRRKLELPDTFLGSSNLCTPGQIDLKAKIGFQNSLAQIEFTEGCAPGQIEFVLKAKIGFQNSLGQIEFTEGCAPGQFGKETVGGASRGSGGARKE